jgi:hypothetical protein
VAAICVVATALPACDDSSHGTSPEGLGSNDAGGKPAQGDASHLRDAAIAAPDATARTPCKTDDDCTPVTECSGNECVPKAVCPSGLEATFDSIHTEVFAVSCGTDGGKCHSHEGAIYSGGLNLADDPYTALLGSDGKGELAGNISGSEKNLRRVVPGDPDQSFLVIKLSTHTGMDPKYGSGMPYTDPGSVCPDTLSTIRQWIAGGAKK